MIQSRRSRCVWREYNRGTAHVVQSNTVWQNSHCLGNAWSTIWVTPSQTMPLCSSMATSPRHCNNLMQTNQVLLLCLRWLYCRSFPCWNSLVSNKHSFSWRLYEAWKHYEKEAHKMYPKLYLKTFQLLFQVTVPWKMCPVNFWPPESSHFPNEWVRLVVTAKHYGLPISLKELHDFFFNIS